MAASTLAFFDQMNGVNYQTLSSTNFKLGIVDPDSSGLTSSQLASLGSSGKTIIGYLSIGEAEDYRSYWQSSWNSNPPSWILGSNPNWPGNYEVKFWDPAWQKMVISQATALAKAGYDGVMLDVVDVYTVSSVAAADGGITKARADMVKFVEAIASATKAINPNFKIIQNNALDLLTTNPDDPSSATNTAYLSHIDGVLAESTFYNPNNTPTTWGPWNVQYLEHVVAAGKDVLVIDYPTSSSAQQSFISQAIADGFIPFVGTQNLDAIPSVNTQILAKLPSDALADLTVGGGTGAPPPPVTSSVDTQGVASYTSTEVASLAQIYQSGGASDAHAVVNSIIEDGNKALTQAPQPVVTIVTSGSAAQTSQSANTGAVSLQSSAAWSAALAYEASGNSSYLAQTKSILLAWAKTNAPTGDPVANEGLLSMFRAYDLIHSQFSSSEQNTINGWMSGIADAIIANQAQAAAKGSDTAVNNHQSYALLEVGTIGAVLGNDTYIHYLTDNFLNHVGNNLKSVAGEPAYLGVDYDLRHAYHYVAYNLEALGEAAVLMDQLSHLPGNPYGISYNPFTVQVNGASIEHTLDALLPYASGEKVSTNEFQGSTDPNDAIRLANGTLSKIFDSTDALPALEAADYFGHTLNNPLMGRDYNLAQVAAGILQNDGKLSLPTSLPDEAFLQNNITSIYDLAQLPGSTPPPASMVKVKVAPYSGDHVYDGGVGNNDFVFYKHTGQTTIHNFVGNDILDISFKIYSSAAQALSHVHYTGGNAILPLDTGNSITLVGVANNGLIASDFHIFT